MKSTRGATFRRLGLEFVVVVVGILAALAVDDWRQSREDLALEEHLLTSLVQDLVSDSADAQIQERAVQRALAAAEALAAAIDSPQHNQTTSEELNGYLSALVFLPELEITSGTFAEMTATGSFRVIGNRTLRREISRYYASGASLLEIPRRQVDPRPDFEAALAAVGVVPGYAADLPDLLTRLSRDPAIPVHAMRIHRYHTRPSFSSSLVSQRRRALLEAVRTELEGFR